MIPIVEVEALLISSTGEILLVDTDSGAIAARLVGAEGLGITTKDESGEYGTGSRSLDVNVRSGVGHVRLTGDNLHYNEMTKDQSLTNGSYIAVYNGVTSTGTQKILWAKCVFSNNDINVTITVDDNVIIDDFHLDELYRDYEMDTAVSSIIPLDYIHTEKQGKILVLTFPGGIEYSDYFKIEAKANQANIDMHRGLIVRSEG